MYIALIDAGVYMPTKHIYCCSYSSADRRSRDIDASGVRAVVFSKNQSGSINISRNKHSGGSGNYFGKPWHRQVLWKAGWRFCHQRVEMAYDNIFALLTILQNNF